jgi:hypothetical protein
MSAYSVFDEPSKIPQRRWLDWISSAEFHWDEISYGAMASGALRLDGSVDR